MQRFVLRDDQWERIKGFLPGREGHVGGTPADTDLALAMVRGMLAAESLALPTRQCRRRQLRRYCAVTMA